jgi:predicted Zn-dependent peptidase
MLRSLKHVADFVGNIEFRRAKNQLKSSLLMNLESKSINFEDIARYSFVMQSGCLIFMVLEHNFFETSTEE